MEVGKKYQNKSSGNVYECIFITPRDTAVLKGISAEADPEWIVRAESISYERFEEYIEPPKPVVHTRYVFWWKSEFAHQSWSVTMSTLKGGYKVGHKSSGYTLMQIDELTHIDNLP